MNTLPTPGNLARLVVLIGVWLLAGGGALPAAAQSGALSLDVLVDQIVALFPKLDGDVIEVSGRAVTLSLGRRDGLQAGVELQVYRQGRELRHPRTGEVLGRTEEDLGRVLVERVLEAYAVAKMVEGRDVRPGDRARVSAGKITLTLLPRVVGVQSRLAEAAVHELSQALQQTGRFQVALGDAINVELARQGLAERDIPDAPTLAPLAERFKAEKLLIVQFKRLENRPYMEVRLLSFPAATPLLSTALFVPPSIKPPPQAGFSAAPRSQGAPAPPRRSLLARIFGGDLDPGAYSAAEGTIPLAEVARFPFSVLSLDVALQPSDRVPRVALTDGDRIYLYRVAEQTLEPEWTHKGLQVGQVFSVQLADLDGDGVLEVVINRYDSNPKTGLLSFILTTRQSKASTLVADVPMILYAVDADGDGVKETLWAQSFAEDGFFKRGSADRYLLRDGALKRDGPVPASEWFRAMGATMSNIAGKDRRALVFIDPHSRLRIAAERDELWRSTTPVGGHALKLQVLRPNLQMGGAVDLLQVEPAPLAVDLDGDGVEEVVVPQNMLPGRLGVVFKSPGGFRFESVNSGFEGTITGLGAIPGPDGPTLIVAVVRFTGVVGLSGETSVIMTVPQR